MKLRDFERNPECLEEVENEQNSCHKWKVRIWRTFG